MFQKVLVIYIILWEKHVLNDVMIMIVQCAHSGSQFSTVNDLGVSRTIQTVFSLILWSEICIFIITRSGHFGHCELYADHSTVTSNESVCLHTDYAIMTGGLQCQLYKVATGNALPSYTRGCRAGRRPPRQIPTLVTLGDRRETWRSQALGPNSDNLVQLSISTNPQIGHWRPSSKVHSGNRRCKSSTVDHGNLIQCLKSSNLKSGL